ncbi:MAG TPA: XrtA/PEP-CTERM system exopolysaccharide export protein [Steroidobacteraceae bacterium]|jgi:polysaccharide export outer membrane protein|nr:XrtA/PEP-CTERM system exopolysaccharide export protein [Steroidobacteraceae bacterium]
MGRALVLMLAGWLAIGPLISSCASSAPQLEPAATTPAQASAKSVDSNYIIGPGDSLEVFVWRNPELSVTVPVRPDGKISTPLVEDMVAVGKTAPQLARDMEKVLAEYVRSPKVNIIVTVPTSTFSQVKIVGQVQHPMALPYREGMTVLDALLAVGGLTQFASGNRARIVRMDKGQETVIHVKLSDLLNSGDVHENVALKPGDVLVVPQSLF